MNQIPYKHLSVLVMPTDYCNMNCVYCFNGRKSNLEQKKMSDDTLQKLFEITIPHYPDVRFIWHGGEPLSMGMEFYKKVIQLQNKINTGNTIIRNTIQTNLTLLDKPFAEFLVAHQFRIGSSYDGITNDKTRHNSDKILASHRLLRECGGNNGFICVVQSQNIDHLIEDYENFKSMKIGYNHNIYMTSNPEQDPLFIPADHYIEKMCQLFDHWMYDTKCNISLSYFETFLKFILQHRKELCCYNSCMGKHIGVHYDGQLYGCNRDFPLEYSFGNIHDYEDIHECFNSDGFNNLLKAAITRRNHCKETCNIFDFCSGGCNSVALMGGDIASCNEYVCKITREMYQYIEKQLEPWKMEDETTKIEQLNPYFIQYL